MKRKWQHIIILLLQVRIIIPAAAVPLEMVNFGGSRHHSPHCSLLTLSFLGISIIAAFFVVDFLWASSTSTFSFAPDDTPWVFDHPEPFLVPDAPANVTETYNDELEEDLERRVLSSTYADLPAPILEWEEMSPAPVPRLDGYAVQIKNRLYVFTGYGDINHVHSHIDIYNFDTDAWDGRIDTPKEMPHSHLGMTTDGRYIYIISGQYGPQCRGPTTMSFTLDTETRQWLRLPSLPVPRYAPATSLWRGRLHVMGGSKENRFATATEHWSLAVKDGKALENEWRSEVPIPRGGPHRACIVVDDKLFVIGGQEGDFMAKEGSPIFKCTRRREVVYGDVYMLNESMKWKVLPPLPKPNSHIECAWVFVNNSVVIVGGTTEKHPLTKKMTLVGEVIRFDFNTMRWSVVGRMPYRVKTTLAGYWNGWLYFTSGQRDKGPDDPSPKKVIANTFRTRLTLSSSTT